ncbi:unnamed protein product [Strongylus vulgaris]|uniref:Uncharacterized protein n=1 Tax=Strongylus vulgaris TaxID=40348 RepID=A0A3P7K302_STRVU|nr:unnamed protein product [Strongylus vulgaris]
MDIKDAGMNPSLNKTSSERSPITDVFVARMDRLNSSGQRLMDLDLANSPPQLNTNIVDDYCERLKQMETMLRLA